MKSLVCPELPTASVGSSQATTAAVDNSAPFATRPQSTYKSGKVVQTNGATSYGEHQIAEDDTLEIILKHVKHCVIAFLCASTLVFAQEAPVPKYLELARELVATVKPENNKYDYGTQGVRWKGDLFTSENTVRTACGGLVSAVFERAKDPTFDKLKSGSRSRSVHLNAWYDAANREYGLKKVPRLGDVQPGDLYMFMCKDRCQTSQGEAQGHIAIIDIKPHKVAPRRPFIEGTEQWVVTVIDSADSAHDQTDTRWVPKGEKKITGVGRGTYRIYTDAEGVPVGYTNGFAAKYHDIAMRPIVISRPEY